ncbi:DNA circularization protein [Jiella pelagia]|uniref:DNA circularization N-terminal domain-containing protein n=1 Tax=Jiella pelagia TaxID=2986949 RepID=A0ABY7BYU4_9HYPH|nr:DNA circularization N-terminal domain-containing protein [Jiella pelagia]WAP69037.1 DNA circularization N-terminal domain-containing protein [Jiella pelagia]
MTWRDNYRQASFRGVPFFVADASLDTGRRAAVHEYALRDTPFVEDVGRKAREFTLSGYVVGTDYFAARDALIEACEKSGPGELIHPYRGALTVSCTSSRFTEGRDNGGMCEFSLTFVESGQQRYPSALTDYGVKVAAASRIIKAAAVDDFVGRMVVGGVPQFVRDAAANEMEKLADILAGLSIPGAASEDMASLARDVAVFVQAIGKLSADPALLAETVVSVIEKLRTTFGGGVKVLSVLDAIIALSPDSAVAGTATRAQARENGKATVDLIRYTALSEKAVAMQAIEYATYNDAIEAREAFSDQVDVLSESAGDNVFGALMDLRTVVVEAVPTADRNLPRLRSVQLAESIPAVVLAYRLYDDLSRIEEIVSRNAVRNPAFLPSDRALEVLTDG